MQFCYYLNSVWVVVLLLFIVMNGTRTLPRFNVDILISPNVFKHLMGTITLTTLQTSQCKAFMSLPIDEIMTIWPISPFLPNIKSPEPLTQPSPNLEAAKENYVETIKLCVHCFKVTSNRLW